MKTKKNLALLIIILVGSIFTALIFEGSSAFAQTSYQINWWTVDGGGGVSSAEEFTLMGTIGQHDAERLGIDEYSLQGGFWVRGILEEIVEFIVNLPLVMR
jgi:hypothetical protein